MEGASCLFAILTVRHIPIRVHGIGDTHDLALIFLRLRLRRRTRFFLHLALIFVDVLLGQAIRNRVME
ncbi:hypothetical protein BJX66DRAFT_311210 [Aspergillus keveii]|uniref:Uncharacterized protein n=1 Tax=Aspergillus keveii TaxID=714993 RepID=A0ABR4FVP9_9EURO